jgi:gas vesicle protein
MANDSSSAGTVMLAFMVGALTGAAVALLFAPASGEETREYLGQKAREKAARARDAMNEGKELYQRQRDNLVSAVERGREAFQQARDASAGAAPRTDRGEQQA